MATSRSVTIKDVAKAAGVSVATTSRALNGRYGVAEETAEKVRAVIDELGYESSLVARSMRSHRTNVIGILVLDLEPFSTEVLRGAARAIRGSEYDMVLYSAGGHPQGRWEGWEKRLVGRLNGSLTDGIIVVTPAAPDIDVDSSDSPVVAIDPPVGQDLSYVVSDNVEGTNQAMRHLLELGHTRIGHIAGRGDLESARLRLEGYRRALEEAGIEYDPNLVTPGEYLRDVSYEKSADLLDLAEPPTAVFAACDESAIGLLRAAGERGVRVPDDLSVVGFDNIPEGLFTDPPLTSVDQSVQQMGHEAVQMLLARIEDPTRPPDQVVLPTRLVVRKSSAAVSGGARARRQPSDRAHTTDARRDNEE